MKVISVKQNLGMLILLLSFGIFTTICFAQTDRLTIAVLDFKDNSPFKSDELKPMEQGLADMMITTLSQVSALKIVERSDLSSLIEEMSLGQTGMIDESSAQQVGKLVGAQYMVLGSFMKGMKKDIRIDCRIVKTETGVTVKAEQVSGKLKEIINLTGKLGEKIIKNLDIKFTIALNGEGILNSFEEILRLIFKDLYKSELVSTVH